MPLGDVGASGTSGRRGGSAGRRPGNSAEPDRVAARASPVVRVYARAVSIRFCDDRGEHGFSWIVDDPMTRTSHALSADGRVWLVDPVRYEPALDRARALGTPAAVVQLLDRHDRDSAALAVELDVPHLVVPDRLPSTPFEVVPVLASRRWHEVALWWPSEHTLVVAEAVGTNRFFTGGGGAAGVHLLMRLAPPRDALGPFQPEHLLVGHGEGLHGPEATGALETALATARTGLLRLLPRVPAFALDAVRRRRRPRVGR